MNWSQKKDTAPGMPDVPLEVLALLATVPDPTEETVREILPEDQSDADATAGALAGLFHGRKPPRPTHSPAPEPERTPDPEPAAEPAPKDSMSTTKGKTPGDSLADRLRAAMGGANAATVIDPSDFETDEIFHQLFTAKDTAYDYSTPAGFTSPGAPTVTYESTTSEDPEDGDAPRESVLITWKPLPGRPRETTLYRVIAADHEVEKAPGAGTELVITHGTAFRDERPATSGYRHYMVWAYTWDSDDELLTMSPMFLGEDIAIFPPRNLRFNESGGTVNGTWEASPGHDSVRVFHARKGYSGRLDAPANMLVDGTIERSGFSHRVDVRGLTYEYTVTPVVTFRDQTRTGNPTGARSVQVSAEIQKVDLLTADSYNDGVEDRILLEWTAPPTGSVKIYLTDIPPNPELPMTQVDKEYLDDDEALGANEWTTVETAPPGEHVTKTMVWPDGWHQVYVTPVNIVEERAWVGESTVLQKVDNLTEPRLIERVTNQLITFDWPGGADLIDVHTTGGDSPLRLSEPSYRRQGGVRLNLLSSGDEVTLTPIAVYAGHDKKADSPTVITYPGLRAYSYDLPVFRDGSMQLQIWAVGYPDANAPRFRLVHNPTRLPLFIGDGDPVTCQKVTTQETGTQLHQPSLPSEKAFTGEGEDTRALGGVVTATASDATWWVDNRAFRGGYLRLFIDDVDTGLTGSGTADSAGGGWGGSSASGSAASGAGFGSGAFGGSLTAAPPESGASSGTGRTTWHAASIPAVIIERDVASRLALPARPAPGRTM
ncbi:hypothetical protein CVAR292_01965 [Corynebacterium variabile]|uniref:Uncharacterized protein n=4 Tax=Corynebacterium variabile TaxID=1727 RepID=A0A0X2NPA7_9CORY|nr:hypothetical protein CVAR292_01965 [Corynebacterium variabile]